MLSLIAIFMLSYLAGSIPTSIISSKLFRGIDIRNYGSGNAGGTNTIRVLGWKFGIAVIIVDVGKGVLATLLISQLRIDPILVFSPDMVQIFAGSCAISGHIWPVFARFKGGKGVGTGGGMLFSLYPAAGFVCLVIFACILLTVRIVSVSSIAAAISLPIVILAMKKFMDYPISNELFYFSILAAILIIYTHRSNIKRLIHGEEKRFTRINQKII